MPVTMVSPGPEDQPKESPERVTSSGSLPDPVKVMISPTGNVEPSAGLVMIAVGGELDGGGGSEGDSGIGMPSGGGIPVLNFQKSWF